MTILDPGSRPGALTLPSRPGMLIAARVKVTTTLDTTGVSAIKAPDGKPRVSLHIRTVTAEIAAKSLREAQYSNPRCRRRQHRARTARPARCWRRDRRGRPLARSPRRQNRHHDAPPGNRT